MILSCTSRVDTITDPELSWQRFNLLVRNALTHLYDYSYLESHPLASLIGQAPSIDRVTRAVRLRRLLLDCIEEIGNENRNHPFAEADRMYAILTYRYVDGLPLEEVAAKRGLSPRQTYRLLKMGVEAVAGIAREQICALGQGLEGGTAGFERPRAGSQTLTQAEVSRLCQGARSESLDPREVLEGVVSLLTPVCQRAGQRISLEFTDAWPVITARKVVLRQGLLVLLEHALDEAACNDLVIRTALGDRALHIAIKVTAQPGRPQPSAWAQPPISLQHPPGTPSPGGLETARALLQAQGGRLEAGRNEDGWYAHVHLPITGQAPILVIDDNQEIIALLRRYLAGYELEVIGASNGVDGLRLAGTVQPRLIILDVMLPDQDGWEVLLRLKGTPATRDIPVVIHTVLQVSQLAEAMGAAACVTKPASQAALLAAITRSLGPLLASG